MNWLQRNFFDSRKINHLWGTAPNAPQVQGKFVSIPQSPALYNVPDFNITGTGITSFDNLKDDDDIAKMAADKTALTIAKIKGANADLMTQLS